MPSSDASSSVLFGTRRPGRGRRALKDFAELLRRDVTGGKPFTCWIGDDEHLRQLNRRFLKKDRATDVLSFPSSERESLGDVAIAAGRAAEQARTLGHTLVEEIKVLMLHGALHLAGYDHQTDSGRMRRRETRLRRKYGLPVGLIERGRP